MRIALTGATGFTGRQVTCALLERGHQLRALVRPPLVGRALPAELSVLAGDMADARAMAELLQRVDAFVNVASLGFGHAEGVTRAVAAAGVERSVFFSSTALFTRLPAATRAVRLDAEARVRSLPGRWTILRPTMIYGGAGDRNLSRLFRFVSRSPVVPLPGGGRALVQPVHVADLAGAVVDVLECQATARNTYELPGGEAVPLRELVLRVARLLDRRRPLLLPLPIAPMAMAAGAWQRLGLPPRISSEQVRRLAEDKAFSYEAARRDWGYSPRGLEAGLESEARALRASGILRGGASGAASA
jgi:uncharacterized protein YbjT (DUF2867 family)